MAQLEQLSAVETIRVRDTRCIAAFQCGAPEGCPCFYFHDTGSNRLEASFYDRATHTPSQGEPQ